MQAAGAAQASEAGGNAVEATSKTALAALRSSQARTTHSALLESVFMGMTGCNWCSALSHASGSTRYCLSREGSRARDVWCMHAAT